MNEAETIKHSCELISGNKRAFSFIEILQQALDEYSFTGYSPFNVGENFIESLGFGLENSSVLLELGEIGLGHGVVAELLVDGFDEIGVANKISGRDSIFIGECFDLILGQVNAQKLHGCGQARYKLIFDAKPFPQLIVILEENFHPNLLLPNFCANVRLYFGYCSSPEPVGPHCIKAKVREVVPA